MTKEERDLWVDAFYIYLGTEIKVTLADGVNTPSLKNVKDVFKPKASYATLEMMDRLKKSKIRSSSIVS